VPDTKPLLCKNYERPGEHMEEAARRILKSDDVKLEGQFCLDIGQGNPGSVNKGNVTSAPAQVCIVENHPEFAVIEVTCGCGAKTHIRCEYIEAQSTEEGPEPKNNGENENESQ
jgi:hypothetical protein